MENVIISCHAEKTRSFFRSKRDLRIFQLDYLTLHNDLASKIFSNLKKLNGNLDLAAKLWKTLASGGIKSNTYFYRANMPMPDYKLWSLDGEYEKVNGLFEFGRFKHKIMIDEPYDEALNLSRYLSDDSDIKVIFWLACTG